VIFFFFLKKPLKNFPRLRQLLHRESVEAFGLLLRPKPPTEFLRQSAKP
jgi:hypothetical protein